MKILGCDFIKTSKGYNVAMCMISNEGGNKIKSTELFERDCKLEDIAGFIIDKFKLLKCDYVIIDYLGLGGVVNEILKYEFGDKVKICKHTYKEEHEIIHYLHKGKILKELGIELKYNVNNYKYEFDRKEYTNFEYLMVKTIGMANKLLNEIEEDKPINITVNSNTNVPIKDLAKEISIMVSNVYKEIANNNCDKFKDNKNDITNKLGDVLKRLTIKETNNLSMKRMIEDNFNYYEQVKKFDLCEKCKLKLENVNNENDFLYNLIVDIEEIKNMLD